MFKAGSSDGSKFKVSWPEITVANYSKLIINENFKAYLNPKRQTIDFIITNFMLQSKVFDLTVEEITPRITKKAVWKCPGNGVILLKNYNVSLSYFVISKSRKITPIKNKKINISDCELDVRLKNDSVKIHFPQNDMPLSYNFSDPICQATIGESSTIKGVLRDALDAYFKYVLPIVWDNQLQRSLSKLVNKEQWIDTDYDGIVTRSLICYVNNNITKDGALNIDAILIPNNTIDRDHHRVYHNITQPKIDNVVKPIVWRSIESCVVIIGICCIIGTICTLKCIKQCLCKHRKRKKSSSVEDIHKDHLLIVNKINNGNID